MRQEAGFRIPPPALYAGDDCIFNPSKDLSVFGGPIYLRPAEVAFRRNERRLYAMCAMGKPKEG